jgi:hypothetical protein
MSPEANEGFKAQVPVRGPHSPPTEEKNPLDKSRPPVFLGTKKRLPEFILTDKVVCVSGAARGLGLTQAEALLEAGATGIYSPGNTATFSSISKDDYCCLHTFIWKC